MIHEKYIDLLPTTKLRRDILKIINGYPDAKFKMENIKDHLLKYGYDDLKDNTLYKNLEYLEKNEFIAGMPLPSMGNPTRPPKFYGIIETRVLSGSVSTTIRCNNPPMQCPNPSCKICAANGEKTCWDLKREELLQKGDLEGLDDLDDRCAGEYIFMTDAAKRKCGIK